MCEEGKMSEKRTAYGNDKLIINLRAPPPTLVGDVSLKGPAIPGMERRVTPCLYTAPWI